MSQRLPVAVVGCGRMGRLHARVFSQMPQVELVAVYDSDPDAAASLAGTLGTTAAGSLAQLAARVRAAVVSVPTVAHLQTASELLGRGVHCLIEKPLARTSDECRRIIQLADRHGAIVSVGHIERFNPVVRAMNRLSIRPGFIEVTRISPLTFRSIDVGVVLDVMIHDIDIVLNLVRRPLLEVRAKGVSVIGGGGDGSPAEDVCNARLEFEGGCVANLTASRLALKTERRLRVFSDDAYVSLDYQKKYGIFVQRTGNVESLRAVVSQIRRGEIDDISQLDYQKLVKIEELTIDDVEPARAQLDAFVEAVLTGRPPVVSAADGLAAVEVAERVIEAVGTMTLG